MNDTIEKFGIFAIRVKLANSISRSSENRILKKKKTKWSIYDIYAILLLSFIKIFTVVAEIGCLVSKYTEIFAAIKFVDFCDSPKIFCCNPVKFSW